MSQVNYYKVGQLLLQSGAGITKWAIITNQGSKTQIELLSKTIGDFEKLSVYYFIKELT